MINLYFNWLISKVMSEDEAMEYVNVLCALHSVEFFYIVQMDHNRLVDGIDLRYRFGYENNIDETIITRELDRPCSVLEMMVALALRCEENIMADPEIGNRTGVWFKTMLHSLGLWNMRGDYFDLETFDYIMGRFLNRRYKPNGEGGLFVIENCPDLREEEIWTQMMWYLGTIN